jgi:anti-sigma B factor antagonist
LFSTTTTGGQALSRHVEPFTCEVTQEHDHVVIVPRGELDMATVGAVEQELRRQLGEGRRSIVLDLAGLSFMDSTGLHLVARWSAEASRDGFDFQLQPGPPAVQRVFELAGMMDELPLRKGE